MHPHTSEPDTSEMAQAILRHTQDGNLLAQEDLALVEVVINDGIGVLTPLGLKHWHNLHQAATTGTYKKPWLHGHEHLTKDLEGFVFWKGISIEHFSIADPTREAAAAKELAKVCRLVEAQGLPMCWPSCSSVYDQAKFGQGYESPRFHAFWTFTQLKHELILIPENSLELREAADSGQRHFAEISQKWESPENALRAMLVSSDEDLENLRKYIREDAAWARRVLRSTGAQCALVEQQLDKQLETHLAGRTLASQRTLSEFVLGKEPDPSASLMDESPNH